MKQPNPPVIAGNGSAADRSPMHDWLPGYARTIAGDTLTYHSPYPEATTALLVRATDGTPAIAWESAPVPPGFDGEFASFLWLAGLATQKGGHRFDLFLDGAPLLSFHSGKDTGELTWEIAGRGGASLRFGATMVDQFGELFGLMSLTLPRASLRPGQPLKLRVVGEAGGSSDWFMVFAHELTEWVRADGAPALVRSEGAPRQLVRVEISHLGPPARVVIAAAASGAAAGSSAYPSPASADGPANLADPPLRAPLVTGYNEFYVPVVAVDVETDLSVSVTIGARPAVIEMVRLRPVARRTLTLLPHSHLDIGYSDPQEVVERKQWGYLEQAIEIARRTAAYPEGARFKWNVEQLWAVETYLAQTSPQRRAEFVAAVRNGWIGLQALLANVLTGVCHPEELFHLTDFARRLATECGVVIDTAMITDIPSYTWSLVPALAQSGVKYLSSGPNYMPGLPDGGDRIGGALRAWGDRPVWWISPSGRERVLLWMAGRGYSWFHGLHMGSLDPARDHRRPIFTYLRQLEAAGYPYETVQVRYTIGGDNGPPDPALPDFVRAWNERYESPRFAIATTQELFAGFARRHADRLPAVRGDFTPYWEDGAASTAHETAMNRASANRLLQAETLWAMRAPDRYPAEAFYQAWRQVILFSEHTWGAAESVSDPDGENTRRQWDYKRALALEADRMSCDLLEAALALGRDDAGSTPNVIDVVNTCAWERTDVVHVPFELSTAGDRVEDESGLATPSQRLTTGELAFLAACVPSLGSRRFRVRAGPATAPLGVDVAAAADSDLHNGLLSVRVDPVSGAVSSFIWRAPSGEPVELVDRREGLGLNDYLYVPGQDPACAVGVTDVKVSVREAGPLVASIVIEAGAPGARGLVRELRLCAGLDRLALLNRLDKLPVREKESVHFAFPFRVPGGETRLDLGWAIIRPEHDQIEGACKDYFCAHNAVDVTSDTFGVTLVCLDAPLVEIGALTNEMPVDRGTRGWRSRIEPTQMIHSYTMNNHWHTNYKADQAGMVDLRYVLHPHAGGAPANFVRTGLETARPLLVAPAGELAPAPQPLPIVRGDTDAIVTSLRPSRDGRARLLRVYNPTDRDATIAFENRRGVPLEIWHCNVDENLTALLPSPLRLTPYECVRVGIPMNATE